MIFLQLFYEFFKIGLFAVGGGMATIPFLMDLTSRYSWFTMADLTNMIAVSESTPGPIGINMATYAGFNAAGIPGALCATLSLVLPAWIIIILIASKPVGTIRPPSVLTHRCLMLPPSQDTERDEPRGGHKHGRPRTARHDHRREVDGVGGRR